MIFASDLYVDKKSQKMLTKKHLIPIAGKGIFRLPLYAVYFPEKGNRPEYCKIEFLHFKYYDRHEPFVIGLASDEENALAIVKDIVEQLRGIGGEHPVFRRKGMLLSIPDAIAWVLESHYMKDKPAAGETADLGGSPKCPECGGELVFSEGCMHCPQCGYSKC